MHHMDVEARDSNGAQLAEGDFFGDLAMIDGGPRSADATTLAKVSAWCEEHGVLPESLSMGQRTLEDVFLQLTGRELVP